MRLRLTNRNQETRLNVAGVSEFYVKDDDSNKIVIGNHRFS